MNLFRLSIIALSIALICSVGSSASTATTHSHPQFTVADDRTLNLRETASRLVVDTIENVLRQGGLALFDERFQIDSSLDWVFGEAVGGELDAVIPLWSKGRHNVFAQPGFVLWKGLADDDRIDGNLGVVYRTETIKGIIGGVSLFYDHDFQIGHSRLGIGVDAQRDGFYGAFNYYHPLSDTQDAREGYVEDALQGMDASVTVESDVTRFGGNVGYWLFQGDEDVEDEWEFSYGFDAGLRLMPGVFLEGRLERHDKKASFGRRASVRLAFRFTLPNLDGKSYGDGGRVSNLYRAVNREKRILYEERESGAKVSIVRTGNEPIEEGGSPIAVEVRLSKALTENVTINLVGTGSATYNDDWTISVGGTDCPMVTEDNCPITIMAGQVSAGAVVSISSDGRGESAETIILSTTIADAGNTGLTPDSPLFINIPEDLPLPTVSLSATSTEITEGGMATLTLNLSEMLEEDVTFNLVSGGNATYGTSNDWHLSVGGVDCNTATEDSPCEVVILAGGTSAEVTVEANIDSSAESPPETATVSVTVDSGSTSIVQEGSPSSLNFTVQDMPVATIVRSGNTTVQEDTTELITIQLNRALREDVAFNFALQTDDMVTHGFPGDFTIHYGRNITDHLCSPVLPCTPNLTIRAGETSADVSVHFLGDNAELGSTDTDAETFTLSITIESAGSTGLQLGNPSSVTFTIAAN